MRLTRFLKPPQIRLELQTRTIANPDWSVERIVRETKERVLAELSDLLEASGNVNNPKKLLTDLLNRERRATTGIGEGIAIPHVRTMQAKRFTLAFARSREGVEFGALDGAPVHFFFAVVAPPYDDRLYLQVYKRIGEVFGAPDAREQLMDAADEHEIIRLISRFDEP